MDGKLLEKIKIYLENHDEVAFAYVFGSSVSGRIHSESDIDIAVYFTPETKGLEYESQKEFPGEGRLWLDLEKITKKKTDLVVLNRAPVTLFFSVLQNGMEIFVRDRNLLSRLFLSISLAAEDFRYFVDDFLKIRERSHSLSQIDKERLARNFVQQSESAYKYLVDFVKKFISKE